MNTLNDIIPKIGQTVGRYEIVQQLGRGGFGVVFKATQIGLGLDVAIKVMLPQLTPQDDPHQTLDRFEQEATILKNLNHTATIRVLDAGRTENGLPYFALEFVRGRTLSDVIRESPLSSDRVSTIARQVLGALEEAHHMGVVHRDLKPDNVMMLDVVGERDRIKVLDFGIAKLAGEQAHVRTRTGFAVGTPRYMAPEQIKNFKYADGRVDLYALGLIMAECLSGRPAVRAPSNEMEIVAQVQPTPHVFDPAVQSSPLFPIIEQATRKDPNTRFASAAQMRDAIEAASRAPAPVATVLSPGAQATQLTPSGVAPTVQNSGGFVGSTVLQQATSGVQPTVPQHGTGPGSTVLHGQHSPAQPMVPPTVHQGGATSQSVPLPAYAPGVSQQTPAVSQQTPAVSQQTPAVSQQTPAVSQQTPAVSQQTPAASQQTPAVSQGVQAPQPVTLHAPEPAPEPPRAPEPPVATKGLHPALIPGALGAAVVAGIVVVLAVASGGDSDDGGDSADAEVTAVDDDPDEAAAASGSNDDDDAAGPAPADNPIATAPPTPTGVLEITSNAPEGDILIDGDLAGALSDGRAELRLAPGTYGVVVAPDGWTRASGESVRVRADLTTPVRATLMPDTATVAGLGTMTHLNRDDSETHFYGSPDRVTVSAFEDCLADSACAAAVGDLARTHSDHRDCRAGSGDDSQRPVNCLSQAALAAFCAHHGLRVPTSDEWDTVRDTFSPDESLWEWTATEGSQGKHIVRGGPGDSRNVDEIDEFRRSGVLMSAASPNYAGGRCVGDADAVLPELAEWGGQGLEVGGAILANIVNVIPDADGSRLILRGCGETAALEIGSVGRLEGRDVEVEIAEVTGANSCVGRTAATASQLTGVSRVRF